MFTEEDQVVKRLKQLFDSRSTGVVVGSNLCCEVFIILAVIPSPGTCTLKWCDGLRASMTPRAISVGVSHSWQVQPRWTGLWGKGQTRVGTHADSRSRKMLAQPQRGPPPATGVSDPEHVAGKGQSRATGYNLNICHWNAEEVRTKKLELQTFLKTHNIYVCCIQETHLSPNYRFSVRGFETFRRDRTRTQRRTSYSGEEHLPSCRNPQIRRRRHTSPRNQTDVWKQPSVHIQPIFTTTKSAPSPCDPAWREQRKDAS